MTPLGLILNVAPCAGCTVLYEFKSHEGFLLSPRERRMTSKKEGMWSWVRVAGQA
jgi:hypothetical protein